MYNETYSDGEEVAEDREKRLQCDKEKVVLLKIFHIRFGKIIEKQYSHLMDQGILVTLWVSS